MYCSSTELDGEGDEAVVMLNVALENVGAGAQHPLKSETRLAFGGKNRFGKGMRNQKDRNPKAYVLIR